jgi:endoglucanase
MKRWMLIVWMLWVGSAQAACLEATLKGVNLAGAEFASERLPGTLGTDYAYPAKADLAYFRAVGMNTVRLPFRWERVQHALLGPLDAAELAQLRQVVRWAQALNLCIVLDMHNYGTYRGQPVGSSQVSVAAFTDAWLRLAAELSDPGTVVLGLMNEPAGMRARLWLQAAQATVLALRQAGARQWVLVGSGRWSGAHEWETRFDGVSAAEAMAGWVDPLHRMAMLKRWSQAHGLRFFMGEFGGADSPACLADLRVLLESMQDASVWLGWTYWAAGSRWGNYPFSVHPGPGAPAAQLLLLREFVPAP